jgi:RHS repeat-associated protein
VARTVDGVTTDYVLDPAAGLMQVLVESTGGQQTAYLYGHDLLAQYDSGTWAYHVDDGLGSVRQLADLTGQVVASYRFSPFGVPLDESGGEPYGFTGEQWDASAGLVHLRARYYEPEMGRFVTRDPWTGDHRRPLTLNPYLYVLDNPVNLVDLSGLQGPGEQGNGVPSELPPWLTEEEYSPEFLTIIRADSTPSDYNFIAEALGYPTYRFGGKAFNPMGWVMQMVEEIGKAFLEIESQTLNLVPLSGQAKQAAEGVYGKDFLTGRELSGLERSFVILTVIPEAGTVGRSLGCQVPEIAGRSGIILDLGSGGIDDFPLDALGELGRRNPDALVVGVDNLTDIGSAIQAYPYEEVLEHFAPNLLDMMRSLPDNVVFVVGDYGAVVGSGTADLVTVFNPTASGARFAVTKAAQYAKAEGGQVVVMIRQADLRHAGDIAGILERATGNPVSIVKGLLGKNVIPGSFADTDEVMVFIATKK